MIVKMTKYSLVLPSSSLDGFLASAQELGMVDITRKLRAFDSDSRRFFELISRFKGALKNVSLYKEQAEDIKEISLPASEDHINMAILEAVEHSMEVKRKMNLEIPALKRKRDEAALWGDFDRNDISRLEKLGYCAYFYTCPENKFDAEIENQHPTQILNQENGRVYFTILTGKQEEAPKVKYTATSLPEYSAKEYDGIIADAEQELKTAEDTMKAVCFHQELLKESIATLETNLEMYMAKDATMTEGDGYISILEAFAPTEQDEKITAFLDESEILYLKDKAAEEDNPPVLLKNNRFARLFEPIGEMYMLPKYGEVDLTPYFAPFYMLFFGLCLGDIGYGIVLVLAGAVAKWKMPSMKGYASLVQMLGIGSIVMPLLSGTFFGMKLGEVIPQINSMFLTDIQMFWFAIIFGVFQIVFAKIFRGISQMIMKGWQYGLADIGWGLLITAGSFAYAAMEGTEVLPSSVMTGLAIAGAALILFFSSIQKNIILRVVKGVTSFWDVTGVFGDVLSYIRLFGLGTAGGILGLVVNSVASQMGGIPYVGWLLMGIMLLIGHTAVLFLSALGAFVHPMRLTFVEFYKNSGFEGGGRAFRPFKKGQVK